MTAVRANSHHDRPCPKERLPFTQKPSFYYGAPQVLLEYEGQVLLPTGTLQTLTFSFGTHDQNPHLHASIIRLMEMFWEKEKQVDRLAQERDELITELAVLKGDNQKLHNQVQGYKSQKKG